MQKAGLSDTDFVARSIVLHTDVARLDGVAGQVFRFADGQRGQPEQTIADHWRMARSLVEALNRKAGRDSDLVFWYRATLAYMISIQMWSGNHAVGALERFGDAADLTFLVGCLHERLASPGPQASIAATRLPAGVQVRVGSEEHELDEAASLFRRALGRDGRQSEARLHYGRVLTLLGKPAAAVTELRRAVDELKEPEQQYYAQLFLGAALEATQQIGAARIAYQAALTLFADAQAPRLALSYLAASRGDREGAAREIAPLFERASHGRHDPWVGYFTACGRDADALLVESSRRLTTPRQ